MVAAKTKLRRRHADREERPPRPPVAVPPSLGGWRELLIAVAVALLVFGVLAPTLRNGFVDWDDPDHLLKNPAYRGLGAEQLAWMFTTFHMGHYQPLSWVSLAIDYMTGRSLFGDGLDPRTYHFTNNLLHALNAALVYLLALRLLARAAPAYRSTTLSCAAILAALLLALHPLRVESVAWATERRDVLSTFFLLLTTLAYLRAVLPSLQGRGQREAAPTIPPSLPGRGQGEGSSHALGTAWYFMALLLYTLSLLSRAMGITLPIILLLLDWYPLRRVGRWPQRVPGPGLARIMLEKLPFLALAATAAIIAVIAQRSASATAGFEYHGVIARLAQACYGVAFYVWKTILPVGLSPIYELRLPINIFAPRYMISAAVVALALIVAFVLRRRLPSVTAALLGYIILLAPVSGFGQSGNQEVADRYSYVPSIALVLLTAGGAARLWSAARIPAAVRVGTGVAAAAIIAALGVQMWRQCAVWHNTATLWEYAARASPGSSIAQNGYGWVLLQEKRYDEALARFRRALELQPTNPKAHHNIWIALREQGRTDELVQAYRDSARIYPTYPDPYYFLGVELHRRGQDDEARTAYETVLRLNPRHARAHTNLGQILARAGNATGALQHYQAAVQADPRLAPARRGLASLLADQGRTAEAAEHLRAALQLDPNDNAARAQLDRLTNTPTP